MHPGSTILLLLSTALISLGVGSKQHEAEDHPFAEVAAQRSATDLKAWCADHPAEVFVEVRNRLSWAIQIRRAGNSEAEARWRDECMFLAQALPDPLLRSWTAAVLAWEEEDIGVYSELRKAFQDATPAVASGDPAAWESVLDARDEAERLQASPFLSGAYARVAKARYRAGHRESATAFITDLMEDASSLGNTELTGWGHSWLARIAWNRGDLQYAEEHMLEALEIQLERGDIEAACSTTCDLASVQLSRGNLEKGLGFALEANSLAHRIGDADLKMRSFEAKTALLIELGDLEKALSFIDALERDNERAAAVEAPATEEMLHVRLKLQHANILGEVGRIETARDLHREALEVVLSGSWGQEAPLVEAEILMALGLNHGDLGESEQGLALIEDAIELFGRHEDRRGTAWAQKNRGWILIKEQRYEEALAAFAAGIEYGQQEGVPFLEGWCSLGAAEAGIHLAEMPEDMDSWISVSSRCARELSDWHMAWRIEAVRGRLALERADPREALDRFREAVIAIEQFRRRLQVPGLLTHYLRDKANPYREAALAAARQGQELEALGFAELLRGRMLYESRSRRTGQLDHHPLDPVIDETRRHLNHLESLLRVSSNGDERERLNDELHAAERALDAQLLRSQINAPRRARLDGVIPARVELAAVQKRIAAGGIDCVIEYLVHDEATVAFLVLPESISAHILEVSQEELEALIMRIRRPIEDLQRGELDLFNLGFDVQAAESLYAKLVQPLEGYLGETVIIVPDGPLWSLPFELLVCGGARSPVNPSSPFAHHRSLRYWLQDHVVGYAASTSLLAVEPVERDSEGAVAFVAPDSEGLTNTRREVAALIAEDASRSRFGDGRLMSGATIESIQSQAQSARWLHFAFHGYLDSDYPAHSHLALMSEDGRASRLEAWEIESLRLNARLAVLSACHSGEGATRAGEGLLGLTRSFLLAGAEEVIASMWAVDDLATADLMESFYRSLAEGAEPLRALRKAKLSMLESDDERGFARAHPYFWAAWVTHRAN